MLTETMLPPGLVVILTEHKPSQGVIFVDTRNRPVLVNRIADAILGDVDGIAIVDGELRPSDRLEAAALRQLITAAVHDEAGSNRKCTVEITRPSQRRSYCLLVLPLRTTLGWLPGQTAGAIVLMRDPERAMPPPAAHLRRLFGLTPAEAALTMEILRGNGLQTAAAALRISLSTARTHLQHVFAKTGTNRQAELVHLVAEMPSQFVFDVLSPISLIMHQAAQSHIRSLPSSEQLRRLTGTPV